MIKDYLEKEKEREKETLAKEKSKTIRYTKLHIAIDLETHKIFKYVEKYFGSRPAKSVIIGLKGHWLPIIKNDIERRKQNESK